MPQASLRAVALRRYDHIKKTPAVFLRSFGTFGRNVDMEGLRFAPPLGDWVRLVSIDSSTKRCRVWSVDEAILSREEELPFKESDELVPEGESRSAPCDVELLPFGVVAVVDQVSQRLYALDLETCKQLAVAGGPSTGFSRAFSLCCMNGLLCVLDQGGSHGRVLVYESRFE